MADELFQQEKYTNPKESFIEFSADENGAVKQTEIKDKEDGAPDLFTAPKMEILKYVAKKAMNTELVDPDQSCKRCHGLGYIGVDTVTHLPQGCPCIFPTPKNLRRIEKQKARSERVQKEKIVNV